MTNETGVELVDLYDPANIYRSIFGSKVKSHRQVWPNIDLSEPQSINPDCVGWIHMDGYPMNYPVAMRCFDRRYYFRHNYSGEEPVRGRVALDFRHGRQIADRTTELSAHHMKVCSVFHVVRGCSRHSAARVQHACFSP